jgi:hypothetical protein
MKGNWLGIERINRDRSGTGERGMAGFTLLEMAFIIVIMGVLSVPIFNGYIAYMNEQKVSLTDTNLSRVMTAIGTFSPIRYPCPSNRALPQGHQDFGKDVCKLAEFDPDTGLDSVPLCDTTGAMQGICKAPATRDTMDDDANEFVLIGGVPIESGGVEIPGLSVVDTVDGWGRRLTYAVSYTSSRPNRTKGFDRYKNGVVRAIDDFGFDTAGTNNDAQFVIFSHGLSGKGAYIHSQDSTQLPIYIACDVTTKDGENCDGDSTFVQGMGQYRAAGTNFYDDMVALKTSQGGDLWIPVTTPDLLPTDHLKGLFTGSVGINTDDPGNGAPSGVILDVKGDVKAGAIRADQLCNLDGTKCIDNNQTTGLFARKDTAKNSCANGNVMTGISGGVVQCTIPDILPPAADVRCPVGYWIRNVLSNGKIQCTNGVVCPGGTGCT